LSGVAWQNALAEGAPHPAGQPPSQPAALASSLSYYFISGNTYMPSVNGSPYTRQVTNCVNQIPLPTYMLAHVHLPQAWQVISATLFSNDNVITTTFSMGYFNDSNVHGGVGALLSADSDSGLASYQHCLDLGDSPVTIENQHYSYKVEWRKVPPGRPGGLALLKPVRRAAGLLRAGGGTFMPVVERKEGKSEVGKQRSEGKWEAGRWKRIWRAMADLAGVKVG
jgi:hypothetical protein